MSDFHPGLWNPAWSVSTILVGLLSFMLADELTTGAVRASPAERRDLARASRAFNRRNRLFQTVFADLLRPLSPSLPTSTSALPHIQTQLDFDLDATIPAADRVKLDAARSRSTPIAPSLPASSSDIAHPTSSTTTNSSTTTQIKPPTPVQALTSSFQRYRWGPFFLLPFTGASSFVALTLTYRSAD